jgi:CheY-like chemotaxis protein
MEFEADTKIWEILLVEDNPADVRLIQEGFKHKHNVHVVVDGGQAMAFLRHEPPFQHEPSPNIVILDLNLPRISGREALTTIKSDPVLRSIPVIVLTTSEAEQDIASSYELGANAYITKPLEFDRFVQTIRSFEEFWLNLACLPKKAGK